MSYRPPGVRVTQKKNALYGSIGSFLPTLIIGSGPSTLTKTFRVLRSTSLAYDAIVDPDGGYLDIANIVRIGDSPKSTDYVLTTDYAKASQTIDGESVTVVNWVPAKKQPVAGSVFYVTVEYTMKDSHYDLKMFSKGADVEEYYGPDVISGAINNISLATQIALENVDLVYALKVKKAGAAPTTAELQVALNKLKSNKDVYRLVLAEAPTTTLNSTLVGDIRVSATPDEGLERDCLLAAEHTSSDSAAVIANVGGYATALSEERAAVIYPDKATRTLSDGKEYVLGGQFIIAALAGLKSSLPPEASYTNKQIRGFNALKGIPMSKAEKNILASKGVFILEQESQNFPISVRHGMSTNYQSIQSREISVTELTDYCSRVVRSGLIGYIGQTITPELLTKIEGTVSSIIDSLKRNGHILAGSAVTEVYQIESAPDSIAVAIRIYVPYPCNYIDVTIMAS